MALYMKAAEILEKVEQKKGAVKTLVYDSKFQVSADVFASQASIKHNWVFQLWALVTNMVYFNQISAWE